MISGASEEELTEAIGRADVLLEFMPKIKQLQKENQQLKSNWNKLREWLESNWEESQDIWFVKIINKMQKLEQGSDSNVKE